MASSCTQNNIATYYERELRHFAILQKAETCSYLRLAIHERCHQQNNDSTSLTSHTLCEVRSSETIGISSCIENTYADNHTHLSRCCTIRSTCFFKIAIQDQSWSFIHGHLVCAHGIHPSGYHVKPFHWVVQVADTVCYRLLATTNYIAWKQELLLIL